MPSDLYPRWFRKYHPPTPPEANPYYKWLTWLAFAFIFLICYLSFWDWFSIKVLADNEKIADYRSVYSSPEDYADSAIRLALACLPILFLLALAIKKGTQPYRLLSFASIIVAIVLGRMLS
jgi:hypothetical protein